MLKKCSLLVLTTFSAVYGMQRPLPIAIETQQLKDAPFTNALVERLKTIETSYSIERKNELIAGIQEHPALITLKLTPLLTLGLSQVSAVALDPLLDRIAFGGRNGIVELLQFAHPGLQFPGTELKDSKYITQDHQTISILPIRHISFHSDGLRVADDKALWHCPLTSENKQLFAATQGRKLMVSKTGTALITCPAVFGERTSGFITFATAPFKENTKEIGWVNEPIDVCAFDQQDRKILFSTGSELFYSYHNRKHQLKMLSQSAITTLDINHEGSKGLATDGKTIGLYGLQEDGAQQLFITTLAGNLSLRRIVLLSFRPLNSIWQVGCHDGSMMLLSESSVKLVDSGYNKLFTFNGFKEGPLAWLCRPDLSQEVIASDKSLLYMPLNFCVTDQHMPLLSSLMLLTKAYDHDAHHVKNHEYTKAVIEKLKSSCPELTASFVQVLNRL